MNESLEILQLNDDCLRELFSYLPSIDLCAVKHTCRRFKTLADEVAKKRFKDVYECDPNDDNLQEHTTILKEFGKFVSTMSLMSGPRGGPGSIFIREDEILPLPNYCKSLVELNLVRIYVPDLTISEMCDNLRALTLIHSFDNRERVGCAPIISACKRLEVFGFLCGYAPVSPRLYRDSSTIKHITTDDIRPHLMYSHLPTPEDMAKLFTVEFKATHPDSRFALNIDFLAEANASLVNLVLNMPARTEDFCGIAESLRVWTNLMSYDIITGFQLPDEICKLFSNLIFVGRANRSREYFITYTRNPKYIYKYKWIRDPRLFQAGSDEESRFAEFQVWKKEMKKIGLHIDTL